jgi:hypothetical protein
MPHLHGLRILEFAAGIALVFQPKKAGEYLKRLGIPVDMTDAEATDEAAPDIHDDAKARARLLRELM